MIWSALRRAFVPAFLGSGAILYIDAQADEVPEAPKKTEYAEPVKDASPMDVFMASRPYMACVNDALKGGEAALRGTTETFKNATFTPLPDKKLYDIDGAGNVQAGLQAKNGPVTLTFQMEGNVHNQKINAGASIRLDWHRSSVLGMSPTEEPLTLTAVFDRAAGRDFAAFLKDPEITETLNQDTRFGPDLENSRSAMEAMTKRAVGCAGLAPGKE